MFNKYLNYFNLVITNNECSTNNKWMSGLLEREKGEMCTLFNHFEESERRNVDLLWWIEHRAIGSRRSHAPAPENILCNLSIAGSASYAATITLLPKFQNPLFQQIVNELGYFHCQYCFLSDFELPETVLVQPFWSTKAIT